MSGVTAIVQVHAPLDQYFIEQSECMAKMSILINLLKIQKEILVTS